MNERLKKQLDFILEIDKAKNILRQTHLSGHGRQENDAEHSWHMAVMAILLREYANEEVDVLRVITMLLIHDLVEIDAGDTYAYDDKGNESRPEEFEAYESPEAKYAHMLDNFQPLLLNDSNQGGDWRAHGVKKSQIYKRNEKTEQGSREIWSYMQELIQRNIDEGNIKEE